MIKDYKRQSGFGVIEILLLIVVAGVLGATGWYALNSKQKTDQILDQAAKISQSTPVKNSQPKSYLVINEWDVKIPLTPTIGDAYYSYFPNSVFGDKGYIGLSIKSITDPNCSPGNAAPVTVYRMSNSPSVSSGEALHHLGKYFYLISPGSSVSCSISQSQLVIASQKAFFTAFDNLQLQ